MADTRIEESALLKTLRKQRHEVLIVKEKPIDIWTGRDLAIAHLCVLAVARLINAPASERRDD